MDHIDGSSAYTVYSIRRGHLYSPAANPDNVRQGFRLSISSFAIVRNSLVIFKTIRKRISSQAACIRISKFNSLTFNFHGILILCPS